MLIAERTPNRLSPMSRDTNRDPTWSLTRIPGRSLASMPIQRRDVCPRRADRRANPSPAAAETRDDCTNPRELGHVYAKIEKGIACGRTWRCRARAILPRAVAALLGWARFVYGPRECFPLPIAPPGPRWRKPVPGVRPLPPRRSLLTSIRRRARRSQDPIALNESRGANRENGYRNLECASNVTGCVLDVEFGSTAVKARNFASQRDTAGKSGRRCYACQPVEGPA